METRAWMQRRLLGWYAKHRRDLPWRRTKNPYHILVSEVMLQQTQVERVVPKYKAFLAAFPTIRALARAPQAKVIVQWSGLGYNRRARNLHQLAKQVVRAYRGALPKTQQELLQLPGIGPYTAAAVACFAFAAPVALVDVNVRRVLGRVYNGVRGPSRLSEQTVWQRAGAHVPTNSTAWNSALMDLGAMVCTARAPKCVSCPLQQRCRAYPAALTASATPKKRGVAFQGSNRYWRGKVLRLLQGQPAHTLPARALYAKLAREGLQRQRAVGVVLQLAKEKLLRKNGRSLSL